MIRVSPFDPTLTTSGTIHATNANRCAILYLINESHIGMLLRFQGGKERVLPPWFSRAFRLEIPGPVEWSYLYTTGPTGSPVTIVTGEVYDPSEIKLSELSQGPLMRVANVGNSLPISGSTNSIVNDGNPAATQIVESTQVSSTGSNVIITNSGDLTLRQYVSSVLTDLFKVISGVAASGTNVQISDINHVTSILGKLLVKDIITATGTDLKLGRNSVDGNVLDAGSADTYVKAATGAIIFQVNGIQKAVIGNDLTLANGSRVCGINQFSGTGSGTFSHNSGGTPQYIGVTPNFVGSATVGVGNINSTTCQITIGVSQPWTAVAIRYT